MAPRKAATANKGSISPEKRQADPAKAKSINQPKCHRLHSAVTAHPSQKSDKSQLSEYQSGVRPH